MSSPLSNLAGPGKPLAVEAPDPMETAGLIKSARARLTDAAIDTLSPESRFDLACKAAHALCLAALRHHGFRPRQRYIVFQVLPHTLGLGPEVWRVLAKAHELRNLTEYEGHVDVDQRLVRDLISCCQTVAVTIEDRLA